MLRQRRPRVAGRSVYHEHTREQGFGESAALIGVLVHVEGAARSIDERGRGFRVHQVESLGCDGDGIAHRTAQPLVFSWVPAAHHGDSSS